MHNRFNAFTLIIACAATACVTLLICAAPRIVASGGGFAQRLEEIRGIIAREFYVDAPEETLLNGAASGMADALDDPYSHYFTAKQMDALKKQAAGVYYGIGVQVNVPDGAPYIEINRVFRGGTAHEAGLKAGDRIMSVDGVICNEDSVSQIMASLRTEDESSAQATVLRGEDTLTFTLNRGSVSINRVEYAMMGEVGYIALYEFMGSDVPEFRDAVYALMSSGARGLLVDLRNNPGGMLSDAVSICDALLPPGVVVYTINRGGSRADYRAITPGLDVPIAVLVNGMSASASEILAGALRDMKAGIVLGERTYGKGVVQTLFPLTDGAGLQITTSRYFTPAGHSIHGEGIMPDYIIPPTDPDNPYAVPSDTGQDTQLKRALEIFVSYIDSK